MKLYHVQYRFKVAMLGKGRNLLMADVGNRFLSKASQVSRVGTNPNNLRSSCQYGLFSNHYLRANRRHASSIVHPQEVIAPGPRKDNICTPMKIQLLIIHSQSSSKEVAKVERILEQCPQRLRQALGGQKLVVLDSAIRVSGGGPGGRNAPRYSPSDVQLDDPNNTIVLCVVDNARRSSNETEHMFADAHKFLEGNLGVRTVCTTPQSLHPNSYENILRKINYMAGGTNFDTPDLSAKFPNVLIAGGHIRPPGKGAVTYCPSVAAVVASSTPQATHFPGSARLQQRMRTVTLNVKGVDYLGVTQNKCIDDLENMMTERFKVWNVKAGEKPPAVVFYRDGLVWDSPSAQPRDTALGGESERNGIMNEEMAAIKSAYNRVFETRLDDLSYVLVHSNTDRETGLGRSGAVQPHTVLTPEENDDKSCKYTYRVFGDDDSKILPDKAAFADLVSATTCLLT
jgi:hypothetical protein